MITREQLVSLGFIERLDIYKGGNIWTLGERIVDICGNPSKEPIITYSQNNYLCRASEGEYCTVVRVCSTKEEVMKFIECINFLFKL